MPPRPLSSIARVLATVVLAGALAACGSDDAAPPAEPAGPPSSVSPDPGVYTMYDVVGSAPSLSTLAGLVASGGEGLRDTAATYTLFAPSDAAMSALPTGILDSLRADPVALQAFLGAHTLPTRMPTLDVFAEITFETPAGTELTVDTDGETVTARGPGGAGRVIEPDLDAANGVVHVVDAVLATPPFR